MKKLLFIVILITFFGIKLNAQVNSIPFFQSSGTYVDIGDGDTVVAYALMTATSGALSVDDSVYKNNKLPFNFNFNGTDYDLVQISANGFITFGATFPGPTLYNAISDATPYNGAIAPFARDNWGVRAITGTRTNGSNIITAVPAAQFVGLEVGRFITGTGIPGTTTAPTTTVIAFDAGAQTITLSANATASGTSVLLICSGKISRVTTGSTPNRIHTIQYKGIQTWSTAANANYSEFQIKLYETTNRIEIVYGLNTRSASATGQVGLRGATNTDYNNRTTTTNWSGTTAGGTNAATCTMSATALPPSGLTFVWEVPTTPTFSVSPASKDFGIVNVNSSSSPQTFTIGNSGVGTLTVNSIVMAGDDPSEFSLTDTNTYPVVLGANQFITVSVSFTPVTLGLSEAILRITDDIADAVHDVPLSGSAGQYNFGGNGQTGDNLYYFANSSTGGSGSPSQPTFDWRDTTGSTSLIVNKVNVGTFGAGSLDDGRYDILGQLPPGNAIRLFGTDYTNFYIGTNGIIGFTAFTPGSSNWDPPASRLPQGNIPIAIFPLWIDINFGGAAYVGNNRLSYKITSDEVIITYDRGFIVGGTTNNYVSFQVIIRHEASPAQNSRITVQYDDATTGSDFLTQYNSNTLRTHLVGIQGSNNANQVLQYRFRNAANILAPGPLFSSPLAVAFGADNTALPVELASFTASVNQRDVNLQWTTAGELNNSGFDVERKTIGAAEWIKAGFVNGNGTTSEAKSYSYTDRGLGTGKHSYRLKQIDYNGNYSYFNLSNEVIIGVPSKFELSQNYPNPFNPVTKINYDLPFDSKVTIKIFDITGREISTLLNVTQVAGYHTVDFNASNLSSGAYFYMITAAGGNQNFAKTLKMMLVK